MASKRYTLVFYVAIAVALGATYGVWRVIESTKSSSRVATAPVVVAARDLPEGAAIDRMALSVAQWPTSTIPVGAYSRVDSVAGRVTRVAVFQGEPFVPGRLAPEGTSAGLETKITPGKRAMGLRINDVSGISGMIQPNSRVDILLTLNPMGNDGRRTAKLFMSNMRVLAMGTEVQRGDDGRPIQATVATLEVSPTEAEQLAVAQAQGQIQLVLRGYGDPDSVVTPGASIADVAASLRDAPARPVRRTTNPRPAPAAPAPVTPAPATAPTTKDVSLARPDSLKVEVYRAGKKTDVKFQKDSLRRDTVPPA